jgi:hypothetical protein
MQTTPDRAALRRLTRGLEQAQDAKLMRAVAVIDDLIERGEADQLMDPLRPRLARLRPARPLRFARLLFMPLDTLIIPPADWRPGTGTIPRNALEPVARTVRRELGGVGAQIEALTAGKTTRDSVAIRQAGTILWPAAACILAAAPAPEGWKEAGLAPEVYTPLAEAVAIVLDQLPAIEDLACILAPGQAEAEDRLAELLSAWASHSSGAIAMLLPVLLRRAPAAASLIQRLLAPGGRLAAQQKLRVAATQATGVLLQRFELTGTAEGAMGAVALAEAGGETRRLASLLEQLETTLGCKDRIRLQEVRRRMDEGCRAQFAGALQTELLDPLRGAAGVMDPSRQKDLEAAARQLRDWETAGRQIGGATDYDAILEEAAAAIGSEQELSVPRRVRLVEIIAGPDAAMKLL